MEEGLLVAKRQTFDDLRRTWWEFLGKQHVTILLRSSFPRTFNYNNKLDWGGNNIHTLWR
jgi:hypothetical protein